MPRKVVLDMDPGIDDAVALCHALADPRLEVLAVTATGGNVEPRQATRNVQALVEQIDPQKWPRIGAATPAQPLRTDARELHGSDGLGGANFNVAELHNRHASIKVLAEEVRKAPGEVTIVATGPLSNVAAVIQREADIAPLIGHLIILGGTVSGPGNVTPAAEFNMYCDSESAQFVFRSRLTKTLVPLDITQQLVMPYDLLDTLRDRETRTAKLLQRLLPPLYRMYRHRYAMEGVYLHDVIAVIVASHPEFFETEPMHGEVETIGDLTHGATVFDRRPNPESQPNMEVVTSINVEAVRDCLVRGLIGDA